MSIVIRLLSVLLRLLFQYWLISTFSLNEYGKLSLIFAQSAFISTIVNSFYNNGILHYAADKKFNLYILIKVSAKILPIGLALILIFNYIYSEVNIIVLIFLSVLPSILFILNRIFQITEGEIKKLKGNLLDSLILPLAIITCVLIGYLLNVVITVELILVYYIIAHILGIVLIIKNLNRESLILDKLITVPFSYYRKGVVDLTSILPQYIMLLIPAIFLSEESLGILSIALKIFMVIGAINGAIGYKYIAELIRKRSVEYDLNIVYNSFKKRLTILYLMLILILWVFPFEILPFGREEILLKNIVMMFVIGALVSALFGPQGLVLLHKGKDSEVFLVNICSLIVFILGLCVIYIYPSLYTVVVSYIGFEIFRNTGYKFLRY